MSEQIVVAALGFAGTLSGSFLGVLASQKLVQYRLEQLEKKVELHNKVVERTFILEGDVKELKHDVSDLKKFHIP